MSLLIWLALLLPATIFELATILRLGLAFELIFESALKLELVVLDSFLYLKLMV